MIALAYIFFFMVYCTVSFCVILLGYRFAKKYFQKGWIGGLIAGLVMYNLVFWDLIPVLIMHKHYCATQAGYWEYQSPEEWVEQHPEVWGQDWSDQSKWKQKNIIKGYNHYRNRSWISPSIYYEHEKDREYFHGISRYEKILFDVKSGEVISKAIEFKRGSNSFATGTSSLADYKFWLALGGQYCGTGYGYRHDFYNNSFKKIIQLVKIKGEY